MRFNVALLAFVSLSNPDQVTIQQQLIAGSCGAGDAHQHGHRACESLDASTMNSRLKAEGSRPFIPKNSHSEDRRVVFIAGLEGSGHHFWREIFDKCTRTGDCVASPDLATALYSQNEKNGLFNHYEPTGNYSDAESEGVRSAFRALSSIDGMHWVNGLGRHVENGNRGTTGMMSYPNFGGPDKIYQHPDVWALAKIAEAVGEDLRVLFVGRQARALLMSTAVHRQFAPYGAEAVILAHNARVLASQLHALDREFVRCVEYEQLPDLPAGLSAWLDPADYEFDAAAASMFKDETSSDHEALPVDPLRDVAIAYLEEALAELHTAAGCPNAASG